MEKNIIKTNAVDKKVLDMLVMAIEEARQNSKYYLLLMEQSRFIEDKEILRQIHLDEVKHDKIFCEIHKKIAGEEAIVNVNEKPCSPYLAKEFEKNIFAKLDNVEFYRQIYFMFLDLEVRDMLFEVITDEQIHTTKLSYLLSRMKAV